MRDFLLEEYKALNEALHINEDTGEKRLTFYISLVTAVLAAVVVGFSKLDEIPDELEHGVHMLMVFALIGLTFIGAIVFRRMKKHNPNNCKHS